MPFLNVSGIVKIWTPLSVGEEHDHSKRMLRTLLFGCTSCLHAGIILGISSVDSPRHSEAVFWGELSDFSSKRLPVASS
jgi:hypothetical protein